MNDKKQYTVEELVDHPEFITWVKEGQSSSSLWSTYGQNHEQSMKIKQEAIDLIELIQFSEDKEDTAKRKEKIWSHIDQSIQTEKRKSTVEGGTKIRPLYWIGAAAAACLACLLIFRLSGDTTENMMIIQATDDMVTHTLPDQSLIDIKAGSQISYRKKNWMANRELNLDGEAFFNVKKGESFTVKTENAIISVLGTSFNIEESKLKTEVICLTGKVKVVNSQSNQEKIITANQSALVEKTQVIKQNHTKIYIPWMEDQFSFTDTKLKNVLRELEQSFNVTITIDDVIAAQEFTGTFEKSSLETALYNICWPMNLSYDINGETVSITHSE